MCGIFGIVIGSDACIPPEFVEATTARLFRFSETRGREAAGLAMRVNGSIDVLKQAGSASVFIQSQQYRDLLARNLDTCTKAAATEAATGLALLGHSRLVTNGFQCDDDNNQPVIVPRTVGVHNGIIVNEAELWARYDRLSRIYDVDTEILLKILRHHLDRSHDLKSAAGCTFAEIEGTASVGILPSELPALLLATNTGALFHVVNEQETFFAFASERFILQRLIRSARLQQIVGKCRPIHKIQPNHGVLVRLGKIAIEEFMLDAVEPPPAAEKSAARQQPATVIDHTKRAEDLRRCSRCILPESYPLIEFDAEGVCNFCREHTSIQVRGERALLDALEPYRSDDGSPDCIVAFSGGRDSSYGLHYIKTVLKMNPVAFTYDWGMVTDLARRNCARICGKLGVEHIIRSADIATKRRYVRQQVEAWLKRPELGMVTLFTAGDKEFRKHARDLRRETGIELVIFCSGNMIENAPYKFGFLGIHEDPHGMQLTAITLRERLAMAAYYAKQVILNPRYINRSLIDAIKAYWHTFVTRDDFLYLYHYIPWSEDEVVQTIRAEYDWEGATDTTTTWRIGDGTAAFYNYIYQTMSGFTEDDDMLSNMVREDYITREEALRRSVEYRQPRIASIREYAQMIGLNCEEALNIINTAPRRY